MPEPDWKDDLRKTVNRFAQGFDYEKETALAAVMVHIHAAYQRGLMAGRSQSRNPVTRGANHRLTQENERLRRERKAVYDWAKYHAEQCEGWCCDHAPRLLELLNEKEGQCPTSPSAPSATESDASAGET